MALYTRTVLLLVEFALLEQLACAVSRPPPLASNYSYSQSHQRMNRGDEISELYIEYAPSLPAHKDEHWRISGALIILAPGYASPKSGHTQEVPSRETARFNKWMETTYGGPNARKQRLARYLPKDRLRDWKLILKRETWVYDDDGFGHVAIVVRDVIAVNL